MTDEGQSQRLCKSQKNTAPISFPSSICWNQSCVVDNNPETEDLAAWNPHWQLVSGQCSLRWSEIKQWKCFSRILLRIGYWPEVIWAFSTLFLRDGYDISAFPRSRWLTQLNREIEKLGDGGSYRIAVYFNM